MGGSQLFPDQIACHHLAIAGCVIFFYFILVFECFPQLFFTEYVTLKISV